MKPLGIDQYVIECRMRITTKISEMFATWLRSTSSLVAARMPMIPPANTNCMPRVQDCVCWYLGSPSTAFRSWTIRFVSSTATARMPNSSFSHHHSTSSSFQRGEVLGPREEVALFDGVSLLLVVGDGRVAELAEPGGQAAVPVDADHLLLDVAAVLLAQLHLQRVVARRKQRAEQVVGGVRPLLAVEPVGALRRPVLLEPDDHLADRVLADVDLGGLDHAHAACRPCGRGR